MASEIERKFLLADDSWKKHVVRSIKMRQNYLSQRPTVRVRLAGSEGFITIKSVTRGCSRAEYEYAIPAEDAVEMLDTLCAGYEVCKTRHIVPFGGKIWEIDIFEGVNAGLELAEIELIREDEVFELPPWIGKEVTGEGQYYNGSLARLPWSMRK
ncbi:MAG: CYTH domain-containing protein [Lentisphaeria bacterium]|nr:CYTH domain-containing protein [Lentisphaeria bacterium]